MDKIKICICMMIMVTLQSVQAQERYEIGVLHNGAHLEMPWTGGLNAPQFSNMDFIRDGIKDMITFDRQGNILRTYIHLPASGRWVWRPEYEVYLPDLVDWVQVVDFN